MWYKTSLLEKQHRAFQERTGNMTPEMREQAWTEEMEAGWKRIEDTVLAFRAGPNILNGGRFDTTSLGTWMELIKALDLTYVPIAMAGMVEIVGAIQGKRQVLSLPPEAEQYRGMVRLDCCGTAAVKADMSVRGASGLGQVGGAVRDGEDWCFQFDDRTLRGLMTYVGQIEQRGEVNCPVWWRPWVQAVSVDVPRPRDLGRGVDQWPLEWRVFVIKGEVAGISAYYTQAPVIDSPLVQEHLASIREQMARLLRFMNDYNVQPWHPLYIDDVPEAEISFSCDFISTPHGPAWLEAGPRVPVGPDRVPLFEWGAHPCCFMNQPVEGVALAKLPGLDSVANNPVPEEAEE